MSTETLDAPGLLVSRRSPLQRMWRGGLQGSEFTWAIAFTVPYHRPVPGLVAYPSPLAPGWGDEPSLYVELAEDPIFQRTIVNTILYVGIGVNLKMFGALLLSGFFMRRGWWVKSLLLVYVLPWALPALPAFISIHWMLNGEWGLLNNFLFNVFGVEGPGWLDTSRWLSLGAVITSHIWKWMPFWTVILLAGRMAIPQELYEAAEVDGATGLTRFTHVTFPLLANLYLVCTLLSTIFTLGDFNSVFSSRAAGRRFPPMCWPRSASACLRGRTARARRGGRAVGAAAHDPAGADPDAQAAHDRGHAVTVADAGPGIALAVSPASAERGRRARRLRRWKQAGALGVVPWC
jgi:ABC-type sugar transport systems, permease components